MKNLCRAVILIALFIAITAQVSRADITTALNYQGRLTDSNGVPIADAAHTMSFIICTNDASCSGTSVWNSGSLSVSTTDGLFSVVLENGTPAIGTLDFNSAEYYIQVTVDATVYTPPQRMTPSANAVNASLLDGHDSSYFMTASEDVWVDTVGDSMTGDLYFSDNGEGIYLAGSTLGGDATRIYTSGDNLAIRAKDTNNVAQFSDYGLSLPQDTGISLYSGGDIQVGSASAADNDSIYFDDASQDFTWNNTASRFELSSMLYIEGDNNATADTSTGDILVYDPADDEASIILMGSPPGVNNQGTGRVYVGQSDTYGGGIIYNGDGVPASSTTQDAISIYRRTAGVDTEVLHFAHNSSTAEFHGMIDANSNIVMGVADPDSNDDAVNLGYANSHYIAAGDMNAGAWTLSGTSLYPDSITYNVGIGTTSPTTKLHVSGGTGGVNLLIEADTDNVTETDNAILTLSQDGGAVTSVLGYPNGDNTLRLMNRYADRVILGIGTTDLLVVNTNGVVQIPTNTLDMQSHKVVNVTNPTAAQDAATKSYVDNIAANTCVMVAVAAITSTPADTSCAAGYCAFGIVDSTTSQLKAMGNYDEDGVAQFTSAYLLCCRCNSSPM